MSEAQLEPNVSRREILDRVIEAERTAHDLLEEAAHVTADPVERDLYHKLAEQETAALRELSEEKERLEYEAFLQRALGDL